MNSRKEIILSMSLILLLVYSGLSYLTDAFTNMVELNIAMLLLLIIVGIWILRSYLKRASGNFTLENKLFNSIINSDDTVYIMINAKTKKVLYLSNTTETVLGIKGDTISDTFYKIINIPVIKNELKNLDKDEYTSQMIEYDNPKYNYQMWIRIKLSKYIDKEEYYIIQIIDSTKEHDRQHILITQATDIKSRESILNQITSKSYDFEINININLNTYELKYFKKDNLYFKEEKRGNYKEGLDEMLECINENDRKLVYDNLNIDYVNKLNNLDIVSLKYFIAIIKEGMYEN